MSHVKESYYFSHDSNARRDPKILALRSVYGAEGYGWYWILVEMLREQPDFKLDLSSKYACKAIAMEMECEEETASQFVHDCIEEFGLFESDGDYFWSNSLIRRMDLRTARSEQARQAARARWSKREKAAETGGNSKSTAPAMRKHSGSNADNLNSNASKVKESKVNKSTSTPPIPPQSPQCGRIMLDITDDGNGNDALKNIYEAFSQNIHPITPFEADGLAAWLGDGMEPELIVWAIRQAVLHGKRTTKYIDAILRNLHADNITTLAGAEAKERNREQAKLQQPAGGGRAREPTQPLPTPEESKRIKELNRQLSALAESKDLNRALEVPP